MAENEINTQVGAEAIEKPEYRQFTQEQLDAIISREKAKAVKGMFSAEDIAKKDSSITALTGERDSARADLKKAQDELATIKQERFLLSKGVPSEDIDYYGFKIGKLVSGDKTFEQAAEEFLKDKNIGTRVVSTGGSVSSGTHQEAVKPNQLMNDLIRGRK